MGTQKPFVQLQKKTPKRPTAEKKKMEEKYTLLY